MLLSESQFKLAALIVKTKELVAFATDTACDETFEILAQFCRDITKETDRRKEQNYANMDLEELLNLSSPAATAVQDSKNKKRHERDDDDEKMNPAFDGSAPKKVKEDAQPPRKRAAPVLWDIHANPNVTEVTMVLSKPLQVEFLARSAGQGRKTPIACYASEAKLLELDSLAKVEKVDQQKRRRIIEKLTKALFSFAATNDLPSALKSCLSKTLWGTDVLSKLEFAESSIE